jgi:hypothetical protein
MIKRVIVGSLLAIALLGAGIAIGASSNGDWGRGHDVVVSGGTSGTTDAGQTIVVSTGHGAPGFFFFPVGLLFFLLFVFVVVSFFRRGGRRGGYWRYGEGGGGPAWLDDWHRRAHERPETHDDAGSTSA